MTSSEQRRAPAPQRQNAPDERQRWTRPLSCPSARGALAGALLLACNTSPRDPTVPAAPAEPSSGRAQAAPASPSAPARAPSLPTAPPAAASGIPSPPPAPSPSSAPSIAPAPSVVTVAAIGDSLTDTRSGGGGYLAYVKARCPESRFDNFGVGGEMVNQMRARFERDLFAASSPRYSHLVLFGGVNDLYSDLTAGRVPAKISRDLAWMYARAREAGMRVIAIDVAPWGGFSRYYNPTRGRATLELNDWIKSQKAAGAVDEVIDAYGLLSCGEPERLCPEFAQPLRDGLHFGRLGHERLGRALYERVFAGCR